MYFGCVWDIHQSPDCHPKLERCDLEISWENPGMYRMNRRVYIEKVQKNSIYQENDVATVGKEQSHH